MTFSHEAIRKAYPQVVTVDDTAGAFDAEGNQVELDAALIEAAEPEVQLQKDFEILRRQRNQLHAETDYLALVDATLTDEMRAYRQDLRDLPANTADPANVVWPTKPN